MFACQFGITFQTGIPVTMYYIGHTWNFNNSYVDFIVGICEILFVVLTAVLLKMLLWFCTLYDYQEGIYRLK